MTERRRRPHPAATSRILVAGLSTASAFALVAGMALEPSAAASTTDPTAAPVAQQVAPAPVEPATTAPRKVVVVVRTNGLDVAQAPAPVPVPAPRPSASTAAPAPVTRSDGS